MRFLSFNIRHAQGSNLLVSNRRIADVIERSEADVVGLSEVYRWPRRFDQPAVLSEMTGMTPLFQENVRHGSAGFGNLVLSRLPARVHSDLPLPSRRERRGCLVVEIAVDGRPFRFATTHLSLHRATRLAEFETMAEGLPYDLPLVVAGDFNCAPSELEPLRERLVVLEDARLTFPARRPRKALDYVMFSRDWRLERLETVDTRASDHLPILADLVLTGPDGRSHAARGSSQGTLPMK